MTLDETIELYEKDIEKYNETINMYNACASELLRVRDDLISLVALLKDFKKESEADE